LLEAHAGESVLDLMRRCHEGLRGSRGVVLSVASFDQRVDSVTWTGVGNVEGRLLRARGYPKADEAIAARGGVVGYQIPSLRAATLSVSRGDLLIFATDGIKSGFSSNIDREATPETIANAIFARYARGSDDALVLVARYAGGLS